LFDLSLFLLIALHIICTNICYNLLSFIIINCDNAHLPASIISKIRFIARDEQLFSLVLYMPVPPTLYFAKWIRLLFSREVYGGMKKVMCLWDAFFDLASARSMASNDDVPIPIAVLDVLKAAAAGMILLIRDQLLAPCAMTGEPDPNNGIGHLMNYPPIDDIRPLIELISDLLAKEKKLSKQYQVSKERKLDKQYLPTESYTSVQMNSSSSVMRPAALTSSVFQDNVYKSYVRKNSDQSESESPDVLPKVYRPVQIIPTVLLLLRLITHKYHYRMRNTR